MNSEYRFIFSLLIIFILIGSPVVADEPLLTNSDVIKLTKMDMGDQIIITTIKTARTVKFDTSINDLVKLKEEGVSRAVITAMLEKVATGPSKASAPAPSKGSIMLFAKEGTYYIKPISGIYLHARVPFYGLKRFVKFPLAAVTTMIKDHNPLLLLNADADPSIALYFVKLEPWEKGLVIDLLPMQGWFGTVSNIPDESYIIPYTTTEEEPGLWRLIPRGELKPGNYGLFRWASYNPTLPLLVGFGIEK